MSRLMLLAALALLVLGGLTSVGSWAGQSAETSHWVEVGVSTEGVRASVDTDSIKPDGDRVQIRQRFVLPPSPAE